MSEFDLDPSIRTVIRQRISRSHAIVIVVGSALFLTLVACCVLIWRNKHIDARSRRLAFVTLLPAAAILARVIAAIRAV